MRIFVTYRFVVASSTRASTVMQYETQLSFQPEVDTFTVTDIITPSKHQMKPDSYNDRALI